MGFFVFCFKLFYINGYFIVFIGCIYDLGKREMVRTTGRIRTGPNVVRHIVWAHRWVFSSSFILLYINGYFIVFIGCIYDIHQREMVRAMGWIIMGPNKVRCVIWAHRWVFIFFSFVLFYTKKYFIVAIGLIYNICQRERVGRMGAAKTGPNDVRHVVWALGDLFFTLHITLLH